MQAEGALDESSGEEDKGQEGGQEREEDEKTTDGESAAKKKEGQDSRKKSEGGQSSDDEEEKESRKGYPILACDHSAITGESHAVDRHMGEPVYYTTHCKRGKAYTVVQVSAKYSFVGGTASMVAGAGDKGHFEIVMDRIGTSLLVLVMAWILAAWIGGFWRHIPIASPGKQTLLEYTLVLLIIGVPVGLPVVTTTQKGNCSEIDSYRITCGRPSSVSPLQRSIRQCIADNLVRESISCALTKQEP